MEILGNGKERIRTALLLAAGTGSRLQPLTEESVQSEDSDGFEVGMTSTFLKQNALSKRHLYADYHTFSESPIDPFVSRSHNPVAKRQREDDNETARTLAGVSGSCAPLIRRFLTIQQGIPWQILATPTRR